MRDILIGTVYMFVIISLFVAFFFGIKMMSTQQDKKLWNDGHCDVCGGILKYEQAVGHRSSTTYVYICEKCGKRIELGRIYNISIQHGRK